MKSPVRVLVVDDHRHIHEVITRVLIGIPDISIVGQAANGAEAVRLCEEVQPDLILMDVVMPVMDGMQATERIREKYPDLKILVLSSFQDHESVHSRPGSAGRAVWASPSVPARWLRNRCASDRPSHQGSRDSRR